MVVPGFGFFLNNQIGDFSNEGRNAITPERKMRRTALPPDQDSLGGKRPRSSMSPTLVFYQDSPFMALGSPGGSNIICTVFAGLTNVLFYDMGLEEAVAAPRYYSRNDGLYKFDDFFYNNATLLAALAAVGGTRVIKADTTSAGALSIVSIDRNGKFHAVGDPRRDSSGMAQN